VQQVPVEIPFEVVFFGAASFACSSPAGPAIARSLSAAATGLMSALNPLLTGVVLKMEASKTAEIDSRAIERATCSPQAWVELFCCFFTELFGLNHFSRFTEGGEVIAANDPLLTLRHNVLADSDWPRSLEIG